LAANIWATFLSPAQSTEETVTPRLKIPASPPFSPTISPRFPPISPDFPRTQTHFQLATIAGAYSLVSKSWPEPKANLPHPLAKKWGIMLDRAYVPYRAYYGTGAEKMGSLFSVQTAETLERIRKMPSGSVRDVLWAEGSLFLKTKWPSPGESCCEHVEN